MWGLLRVVATICFLGFTYQTMGMGQMRSYEFAQRHTGALWMDVYQPMDDVRKDVCVLYVFGGGFAGGSRKDDHNVEFFNNLMNRGYTVVAIEYRLGLAGVEKVGALHPRPGFEAVRMATEDLVSATDYVIKNSRELRIDTRRIVLMGSSAGAITVLQADYELANRTPIVSVLPADFRYAGVVSLAGAVFSTQGRPKYAANPAPTLFYHGTKDKIVVYNKIQLFNRGMFGTKFLAKTFDKHDYPFMAVRYEGIRHEVALFPRFYVPDQICDFIDKAAAGQYKNQLDIMVRDEQLLEKYKD